MALSMAPRRCFSCAPWTLAGWATVTGPDAGAVTGDQPETVTVVDDGQRGFGWFGGGKWVCRLPGGQARHGLTSTTSAGPMAASGIDQIIAGA